MYREQLAEMAKGKRQEANWLPIARVWIPHFQRLNSYRRKDVIRTLRNSVYARLHRKQAAKLESELDEANDYIEELETKLDQINPL